MVKRHGIILMALGILIIFFNLGEGLSYAQEQEITIKELKQRPESYLEKTVKLRAKLKVIGNYYTDAKFVLEDEKGNQFPVGVWAPLEVPPPAPGTEEHWRKNRPRLMSDFLDKWLLIKGKVKTTGNKIVPNVIKEKLYKGEFYIEVESRPDRLSYDIEIIKEK